MNFEKLTGRSLKAKVSYHVIIVKLKIKKMRARVNFAKHSNNIICMQLAHINAGYQYIALKRSYSTSFRKINLHKI